MNGYSETRYALVTGGGNGLGREFCLQLGSLGWQVGVSDLDLDRANSTVNLIAKSGGRAQAELLDVASPAAWTALATKLRGEWPRLDLLVNNAGICAAGRIGDGSLSDFEKILDVNLMGVVNGCHTMVPWLKETAPGGAIVNVASIAVAISAPAMAAYTCSKAAVVAYSETLYAELIDAGIGVTVVLPGFFTSDLLRQGQFSDEIYRRMAEGYAETASFSSREVAKKTLSAVRRRKLYVVIGRRARLVWHAKRLAPQWLQQFVAWKFNREYRNHSQPD